MMLEPSSMEEVEISDVGDQSTLDEQVEFQENISAVGESNNIKEPSLSENGLKQEEVHPEPLHPQNETTYHYEEER